MCVGNQVAFLCQQAGDTAEWIVTLLSGVRMTGLALSSNVGTPVTLQNDPGFGFEIHVLPSSRPSRVLSELRMPAARGLNSVTVTCEGHSGSFNHPIPVFPLGESCAKLLSLNCDLTSQNEVPVNPNTPANSHTTLYIMLHVYSRRKLQRCRQLPHDIFKLQITYRHCLLLAIFLIM